VVVRRRTLVAAESAGAATLGPGGTSGTMLAGAAATGSGTPAATMSVEITTSRLGQDQWKFSTTFPYRPLRRIPPSFAALRYYSGRAHSRRAGIMMYPLRQCAVVWAHCGVSQ